MSGWLPTPALLRSCAIALAALLIAVLTGKPDLVVLAAPFVALVAGGLWRPPREAPQAISRLHPGILREGEATTLETTVVTADSDSVAVLVLPAPYVGIRPGQRAAIVVADGPTVIGTDLQGRRWGRHEVGGGQVAVTSRWAGFRWGPTVLPTMRLTVLPQAASFDSTAEAPHPIGLVGANRSLHNGDGREFSGIREFTMGDRLRRIHWRTSLRTGTLHVVTTTAEQDSAVVLLVDAMVDLGDSGGIDGEPSSLDTTMRAAGALAEHHLRVGDRVGLRVLAHSSTLLAPRAGMQQHVRILESLARVEPGRPDHLDVSRTQTGLGAGTVVLVLSSLLSEEIVAALVRLSRRGLPVVAVDTAPAGLAEQWRANPLSSDALAWRIRMLERDARLHAIRAAGTPVVRWRGSGTLDEVLLRLSRRARQPRVAIR